MELKQQSFIGQSWERDEMLCVNVFCYCCFSVIC